MLMTFFSYSPLLTFYPPNISRPSQPHPKIWGSRPLKPSMDWRLCPWRILKYCRSVVHRQEPVVGLVLMCFSFGWRIVRQQI